MKRGYLYRLPLTLLPASRSVATAHFLQVPRSVQRDKELRRHMQRLPSDG